MHVLRSAVVQTYSDLKNEKTLDPRQIQFTRDERSYQVTFRGTTRFRRRLAAAASALARRSNLRRQAGTLTGTASRTPNARTCPSGSTLQGPRFQGSKSTLSTGCSEASSTGVGAGSHHARLAKVRRCTAYYSSSLRLSHIEDLDTLIVSALEYRSPDPVVKDFLSGIRCGARPWRRLTFSPSSLFLNKGFEPPSEGIGIAWRI